MRALIAISAAFLPFLAIGSAVPATPASAASAHLGFDHNGLPEDINAGPGHTLSGRTVTVSLIVEAPAEGLGGWEMNI